MYKRQSRSIVISAASPQGYPSACGSAWVTFSRIDLSLYSRFGASRRPHLLAMSFRRFSSAVNGSPFSTLRGYSGPLQRVGYSVEKWLVLVHLRPGSGTTSCVPGVYVDCIATGARHCHVLLDPYETPSHDHELYCRYYTERVCWPRPKACSGCCPL